MSRSSVRRSFFSGVIILTLANITVKLIGLVYKIPLTNMLGDEGMGYFNTAYQIYSWLYMLSTAGLPVATSLMISECNAACRQREKKRILRIILATFSLIGLIGSILMAVFCRGLADLISADKAYLCILAISPAFFFVCVSSTLRGYFQGHTDMVPTAVSEILEAIGKTALGILLGAYALHRGLPLHQVAAYSIIGVSAGIAASAFTLILAKLLGRERRLYESEPFIPSQGETERSNREILLSFAKLAIPVMLSASLLGMSSMLDTLIIIRRLGDTGITDTAAIALYGNYTSRCVPLFNLPPALIYPIVNALIPTVSAARTRGDSAQAQRLVSTALRLSAVIALPCAFGLASLSEPVLKLIFSDAAGAEMAAPLLSVLAPSVFLIGVMAVANGILQSYGLQKYTIISMLAGAAVKGISAYFLVTLPVFGTPLRMYAAPVSTFLFYLTITVIEFYFIVRHASIKVSVMGIYFRPFIAALLCGVCAVGSYLLLCNIISPKLATVVAIALAAAVYILSLFLLGAITREDILMMPGGKKLLRPLERMRLLRSERRPS